MYSIISTGLKMHQETTRGCVKTLIPSVLDKAVKWFAKVSWTMSRARTYSSSFFSIPAKPSEDQNHHCYQREHSTREE